MRTFMAVDPGGSTGVAIGELVAPRHVELITSYTLAWEERFSIDRSLDIYGSTLEIVVVEEFRLFKHAAKDLINNEFPSVRMIGALEHALWTRNMYDRLRFQTPSQRKAVTIPEHIKPRLRSQHEIDAFMHLKYYILLHDKELFQK